MSYSIFDSIGNTPLVEIKRMNAGSDVRLFAKLEYMNPGGSVKDRAALFMINEGEKSGALTRDKTVIEATSGNTGIGLAMICTVKGYKLVLTMSESASEERKSILRARGAHILQTPAHLGSDGAIEEVYRLVRENPETYFVTDQYNNEANWKAHYFTTGVEIWEQTGGRVDCVVATIGTSGTAMGISRRLKEFNPHVKIIGAEPYLGHGIQGLKNMKESYKPEIFEKERLDEKINIEDEEAFETARRLAKEEGLFVGMSSGAAMAAAIREAGRMQQGTVVAVLPDSGERYLSTPLFQIKRSLNLHVYNTVSKSKERVEPASQDEVSVYTCGPTAHKRLSVAELRRYIFSDLLCRYIAYRGFSVNQVVNITDLDDKTIKGSKDAGTSLDRFTGENIDKFRHDLEKLGIRPAQAYPRVSENLDEMVRLARDLYERRFAYEKLHSLYFDISSLPEYGEVSGVDINKIKLGATVDLDDYEKENPRDFTLLKRVGLSELKRGIGINTEWGNVRPSLHLQCAAISMKYLGSSFDIHTGSRELLFPHHENEMAISRAKSGSLLARYWMHCEPVYYDGSMGFEAIEKADLDTLNTMGWDDSTIRFWMLSCHYRKRLVLSESALKDSRRSLERINRCLKRLSAVKAGKEYREMDQFLYDFKQDFLTAMEDDLKMAGVVSLLFNNVKKLNRLMDRNEIDRSGASRVRDFFREIDSVLNVLDFTPETVYSQKVKTLIEEREKARKAGNFTLADRLREKIAGMGIDVMDEKV